MQSVSPSAKLSKGEAQIYSNCPLYSVDQVKTKLFGLQLAACDPSVSQTSGMGAATGYNPARSDSESDVGSSHKPCVMTVAGGKTSCSLCSMEFENRQEQSQHFRSDWHLYNLKLKLRGIPPIGENEFYEIVDNLSSSISGSDSDSDDEDTDSSNQDFSRFDIGPHGVPFVPFTQQEGAADSCLVSDDLPFGSNGRKYPKLFLKNSNGELISVYRCILYHKKNPPVSLKSVLTTLNDLPGSMYWAVLLAGGGHFAATIFENGKVVAHKTFHRYTVRAKQGKSQGSRDSRGNAPRSAGSSLRRYNESALVQDVQELLTSWTDNLKRCDLIFLRAPSYNQQMLFNGKSNPLSRNDQRIRIVPFHTRRPTHNETRRVHEMLASVECYGNECDIRDFVPRSPPRHFSADTGQLEIVADISQLKKNIGKVLIFDKKKKKNLRGKCPSGSEDVGMQEMNKTDKNSDEKTDSIPKGSDSSSSGSDDEVDTELCFVDEEISMRHLQEDEIDFGCQADNNSSSNNCSHDKPNKNSNKFNYKPVKKGSQEKDRLKNLIYHACKSGNVSQMKKLLSWLVENAMESEPPKKQDCKTDILKKNLPSLASDTNPSSVASLVKTASDQENKGLLPSEKAADFHKDLDSKPYTESSVDATQPDNASVSCEAITDTKDECLDFDPNAEDLISNLEMAADIKFPEILNERWGGDKRTLLHIVAQAGQLEILYLLLEAGADPALCNNKGIPPYIIATKETRNEFRRFMGKYPDKYGYRKAQIPGPLTPEIEAEKKQKESLRKKAKQQRLRVKKQVEQEAKIISEFKAKQVEEERRYKNLSEREKRALAAERRILNQKSSAGEAKPVLSRCSQCFRDISGLIPYEYYHFRFCTPKCLKDHRFKSRDS